MKIEMGVLLVIVGGLMGFKLAAGGIEMVLKKSLATGYYVLDGKAYKVTEIKN